MRKHSVKKFLLVFCPLILLSALIGGVLDLFIEERWLSISLGMIQGVLWGFVIVALYYYWINKGDS